MVLTGLGREMEMLFFGHAARPAVFPVDGRFFEYEDLA